MSASIEDTVPDLPCFLARFGATARIGALDEGCAVGFGGPGAMATTRGVVFSGAPVLVGVVAVPLDPVVDRGDSSS